MIDDSHDDLTMPESDAVGYGRPPKHTRFKPGQPGNRRGRPRGARGHKTIVEEIAFETHVVIENGQRTKRSTVELVLTALKRHAMSGNLKAVRATHDYLQRLGPKDPDKRGGFLVVGQIPQTEEQIQDYMKELDEHQRKYRERLARPE